MRCTLLVAALAAFAIGCGGPCEIDGKTVKVGESAPAGDGCNTCSCEKYGQASCTEMGCIDTDPDG